MKKPTNYTPYLIALLIPGYSALSNNLWFKSGLWYNWAITSLVVFGLWHWNKKLLSLSNHWLAKWVILILGSQLYSVAFIALDYYVLHAVLNFTGFGPFNLDLRMFLITLITSAIIEGMKWAKAREQSKIENLKLQAEHIENQFNLLIQQTNPEFLFHSLTTLQKMVQTNDPQAEEYILKLANVYRQTLKKERTPVQLSDELAFLRSYMFLMMYGQENAIFFDVTIANNALAYHLPVFSLQLLAENCIKHNTFSVEQPLYIRLFQQDAYSVSIANNHQPNNPSNPEIAEGIEHLNMRYTLEGIENGVTIEQTETTYTATLQLF